MNQEDMNVLSTMIDEKLNANNSVVVSLIQGRILPLHTEMLDFKAEVMEHFAQIDKRLDRLEERMDHLEERMDRLEERMDHLEERMDRLEVRMDHLEERMDRLEVRMDQLEERMDHLENEVAHLKKDVQHLQIDVRKLQTYTENRVEPALCLLSENYVPAANRYEHDHTEMDAMRADIDLLNKTVARHSVELQRLTAQVQTAG